MFLLVAILHPPGPPSTESLGLQRLYALASHFPSPPISIIISPHCAHISRDLYQCRDTKCNDDLHGDPVLPPGFPAHSDALNDLRGGQRTASVHIQHLQLFGHGFRQVHRPYGTQLLVTLQHHGFILGVLALDVFMRHGACRFFLGHDPEASEHVLLPYDWKCTSDVPCQASLSKGGILLLSQPSSLGVLLRTASSHHGSRSISSVSDSHSNSMVNKTPLPASPTLGIKTGLNRAGDIQPSFAQKEGIRSYNERNVVGQLLSWRV
eukprot:scaffold239_cov382-Pavlova_lutheri.AAC.11